VQGSASFDFLNDVVAGASDPGPKLSEQEIGARVSLFPSALQNSLTGETCLLLFLIDNRYYRLRAALFT